LIEAGECEKTGVNGGFLLLDEPTNHLDSNAKKWLQNWIKKYKGTILLVSHDEEVLRDVCTRIVEVKNKKLVSYPGSYAQYLRAKSAKAKEATKILERTGRETKKLETFINTYGAKATKAKQAKDKEKKLEKALEILKDAKIDAETAGAMNVDEAEEMNTPSATITIHFFGFVHVHRPSRLGVDFRVFQNLQRFFQLFLLILCLLCFRRFRAVRVYKRL
jgi:ATPase subunit of ABC transporter with duplicated ATPase domains